MAYGTIDYNRLRADTGLDAATLPTPEAENIFAQAEAVYPDNTRARDAYARVLVLRQLLVKSIGLVDYTEGESQEKQSQVRQGLERLLAYWETQEQKALDTAAKSAGVVRWGGLRPTRTRPEEYPDA